METAILGQSFKNSCLQLKCTPNTGRNHYFPDYFCRMPACWLRISSPTITQKADNHFTIPQKAICNVQKRLSHVTVARIHNTRAINHQTATSSAEPFFSEPSHSIPCSILAASDSVKCCNLSVVSHMPHEHLLVAARQDAHWPALVRKQ